MIMPDANLLIYAVNRNTEWHQAAKSWWEDTLSGQQVVGIPWVVALAFLRITTNRRIFATPLTSAESIEQLDSWLAQPAARLISPGEQHWPVLRNLLKRTGMAGNLTTDAHIAALAIEQGYTVYSADNDFKRFPGLLHVNPLGWPDSHQVHEPRTTYAKKALRNT